MIKEKEKQILELKETIKALEEEKELIEKIIEEHFNIIEEDNKTTILTKENKKLFYKIRDPKWGTLEYVFLNQNSWNKEIFFNICKLIEVDFFGKEDNSFEKDYFEDYEITDVKDYIKIKNNETKDIELIKKYYFPKTIDVSLLIDIIVWYNRTFYCVKLS